VPGTSEVKAKISTPRSSIDGNSSETDGGKKKSKAPKAVPADVTPLNSLALEVLSKYGKKQLTPSTIIKRSNSSTKKEAPPKKELTAAEILNKTQAEYAVSALYNFRPESDQEPAGSNPEEGSSPQDPVQEIKRKRRRRFKKLWKPVAGGRKWSQARIDAYKNRKKRKKEIGTLAERELRRLGHVVINMTEPSKEPVEVEVELDIKCENDFCRLGCICNSLEVPMREEFHCGKAECIFKCICVQAGASNCLFDSRVQDKTRNLAPEEKEFINTVISKGSENLMVAERGKRERKMPHRLQSDFVTGEELDAQGIGKFRVPSKHDAHEIAAATPKKRLLVENWDMYSRMTEEDRLSIVPSPDFLENRCTKTIATLEDSVDVEDETSRPLPVSSSVLVLDKSVEVSNYTLIYLYFTLTYQIFNFKSSSTKYN
jgi:hypothetical protein